MGLGTIVYYLLWPLVITAVIIAWFFKIIASIIDFGTVFIKGFHDEIKKL